MIRLRTTIRNVAQHLWSFVGHETNELRYPATVSICARLLFLTGGLIETSYRVEYGALSHVLNSLYAISMMTANVWVLRKIRRSGQADARWLLLLSAIDVAALCFTLSMSGGFDSRYFAMVYLALALFAWVFTSPYVVFSWTTMVVVLYVSLCLVIGDGVDFSQMEEKELFYRVVVMYAVPMAMNLVTRFERVRRISAVERERELSRQRIEMSQTIHDTTAQSAYTLGLGLEDAIERADGSDQVLVEKLAAMWEVSKSTMWTLRHPIDGGLIFSGSTLSEVLAAHADTFTVISSIPAELVQQGTEPELSAVQRSLLFSIAHNALTNTFRHSEADCVTITLDFRKDDLSMSVSDDGKGLPGDYAARGHGFRNMKGDAERMGGRLEVSSDIYGTNVECTVPYQQA